MPTIQRKRAFTDAERDKEIWANHSSERTSLDAILRHTIDRVKFAEYLEDREITPAEVADVARFSDALCYTLQLIYDRLEL